MTQFRYIVLTETERAHHVVLTREGSDWLQRVATFICRERAESYADVENMMHEDGEGNLDYGDMKEAAPQIEPPQSSLSRLVVGMIEPPATQNAPELNGNKPIQEAPPAGSLPTLADEILSLLPEMLELAPKGPTIKQLVDRVAAEEYEIRKAVRELDRSGKAVLMQRKDSSAYHLVPPDYEAPPADLTAKQQAVMDVLSEHADNAGIVTMSRREICERAKASKGGITATIDALRYKKRIEEISVGKGTEPSRFRVLPTKKVSPCVSQQKT